MLDLILTGANFLSLRPRRRILTEAMLFSGGSKELRLIWQKIGFEMILQVVEGFEVLRRVENVRCDSEDRPLEDVRITDSGVNKPMFP